VGREGVNCSTRPAAWLGVACRLRAAADVLLERETPIADASATGVPVENIPDSQFPRFEATDLLLAYAIENLLKALLIARGRVTFQNQQLPKELKIHNLYKLHTLAGPKTQIPRHVLDWLTYMSEWRSRYPIPTSIEKFWPMDNHGTMRAGGFTFPQSHQQMLAYFDGLKAEVMALL
jgi:hypothetical protein